MPPRKKSKTTLPAICEPDPAQITQVAKWILDGNSESDILEAIAKHYPELKDPGPVIGAAAARFAEAADVDLHTVFGWCFESTRELYRKMVDIGDYAGALRAVKQLAELVLKLDLLK